MRGAIAVRWHAAKWLAFCQLVGTRPGDGFSRPATKNVWVELMDRLGCSHQCEYAQEYVLGIHESQEQSG
jgi:hypothetical protein